jgi:F0F1-type ATP synthase membrane subunit c/vacuolar-type H+-ATPase subunit K
MLLNDSPDSKKSLPAALLLLSVGLLLLSCGIAWQHTFSPLLHLAARQDDFFHGFCMGLALTLEAGALVLLLRIGRSRLKK